LLADTSMLLLGGKLKFKEKLSGRLGDVLSQLYIASAMLKRFEEDSRPLTEQPLLAWAFHDAVHKIELAMSGVLRNFPIRWAAWILWQLVFPWGRRAQAPSDRLGHRAAALLMTPCDARDRMAEGVYLTPGPNNPAGRVNASLATVILAEPVERKFLKALKNSDIEALTFPEQLSEGVREGWISADERTQLEQLRELTWDAISVDDFDSADMESASLHRLQQVYRASAA
jgi:acyl-CoA dehydrogenase